MADPHVSVIVPVRNRRALLATLLDALAAQTYRYF
jgi:glycosyltransferase involved in cell wall biosynthesis